MAAGNVLLERDVETARITSALHRSAAGTGEVVVIEGAAGIGKTQLLAVAGHEAQAMGAVVLRARAGQLERSFAFGVVRQLFAPVLARATDAERVRHLEGAADLAAPLFDPARLADAPGEAIYPLLHGLFWLAVNLARESGLVLCVDDAQWADEPSLVFLEFLSRRVADEPIAVVVATRPLLPGAPPALAQLVADASAEKLRPVELTAHATAALLEGRLGAADVPAFTEACRTVTGGNPFLLGELVRLLEAEGIAPAAATVDRVRVLGTKAVSDSVLMRVSRISAGARGLVNAVAVLGDGVTEPAAAELAALPHDDVRRLAEELRGAGVLAEGPRLAFAHPVLRTAIYETIAPADREQMHVDAAEALITRERPAEQVAAHLLSVPRALGEWALPPLRTAAAGALALGDLGTARQLLERAMMEADDIAVRATLGRVQMLSMDVAAVDTLTAVLAGTDEPALAARAAADLGIQLLFLGRIDELVSVLTETEARVAAADPETAAKLGAGLLTATTISFGAMQRLEDRIGTLADDGRPAASVAERAALMALAHRDALADRPVAVARDRLRRATVTPGLVDDPRDVLSSRLAVAAPMVIAEMYAEADALTSDELAAARGSGSAFQAAAALALRAWSGVRCGRLVAAETDAREALELMLAVGFGGFSLALAQAALLTCMRETGGALGELQAVLDAPAPPADLGPHGVLILARAQALADRGDRDAALASLLEAGRTVYAEASPAFLPWRSAAAVLSTDPEEAVALADDELARARASGAPGTLGAALAARARLAAADAAEAQLTEAVTVFEASAARLEHAARWSTSARSSVARAAGPRLAATCARATTSPSAAAPPCSPSERGTSSRPAASGSPSRGCRARSP